MIRKSLFKKCIREEITKMLESSLKYDFPKSKRKLFDSENKLELLKNEFINIDKDIRRLEKQLASNPENKDQIEFHLGQKMQIKTELETQIQKLQ